MPRAGGMIDGRVLGCRPVGTSIGTPWDLHILRSRAPLLQTEGSVVGAVCAREQEREERKEGGRERIIEGEEKEGATENGGGKGGGTGERAQEEKGRERTAETEREKSRENERGRRESARGGGADHFSLPDSGWGLECVGLGRTWQPKRPHQTREAGLQREAQTGLGHSDTNAAVLCKLQAKGEPDQAVFSPTLPCPPQQAEKPSFTPEGRTVCADSPGGRSHTLYDTCIQQAILSEVNVQQLLRDKFMVFMSSPLSSGRLPRSETVLSNAVLFLDT